MLLAAAGNEDHHRPRCETPLSELRHHVAAIQPWQFDIQKNDLGLCFGGHINSLEAIVREDDLIPCSFTCSGVCLGDSCIVFNDQHLGPDTGVFRNGMCPNTHKLL